MIAVAVCRFHNDVIRILDKFRILDEWTAVVSDISRKSQLHRLVILCYPDFNGRRSEQVSGIYKTHGQPLTDLNLIMIFARHKMLKYSLRIFHVVHRRYFRLTGTSRLTVSPLRLKFLNMCGILKHNITQFAGCLCRKNLSPESVIIQKWQKSRVVNMRMCHKHIIDRCRIYRNLLIDIQIRPLLHTTIYQKMRFPKRHIMAASRYLTVGA